MEQIVAGQRWTYRVPQGFEDSRLIVGASVELNDNNSIVCCSVTHAPKGANVAPSETFTIPFLPMIEQAFWASAVARDGDAQPPPAFSRTFQRWREDPRGLAAFTVPFEGFLDQMIELQKARKKGARGIASTKRAATLDEITDMLTAGLETEIEPFPRDEKEFEDILVRLRGLDPNDLKSKLVIGGFQDHPYGPEQQRCLECIYFLPHNLYCDIPELAVPVEPYWWCRLWRI